MPDLYLYEFLFRGRPPGSDEAPEYHVILAQETKDPFTAGVTTAMSQAMTPAQAKDMGFDITKIVAAIDTATMAEREALRAQVAVLQTKSGDTTQPAAESASAD